MADLGEAFVPIRATMDKLDGDLSDAKGKIEKALGGFGDGLKGAGTIALGVAAAGFAALGTAMAFSLDQALGNEKIQASLAQAIKASGGAAGITADYANELAQSFVHLAGGSDDAVLAIETIGIRAGTISRDEMPAFIQASLDLGAVMGDTAAASTLLARAQEDPIAAMGRLQRSGIIFADQLKDQITALVKSGDAAGATALLMDRVAEATGGAAAANAGTLAGQFEILKGQLGEMAEALGTAALPFLHDLFDNVLAPAIPIMQSVAASFGVFGDRMAAGFPVGAALGALVAEIGITLGLTGEQANQLAAKVSGVVDWFNSLIMTIGGVVAAVAPYLAIAAAWLANTFTLQDVLIALGVAIAAVVIPAIISIVAAAAPIIIAFVAVIAVAALLRHAWEENWGGIQEKTAAVLKWLTATISSVIAGITAFWAANGDAILAKATAIWSGVQAVVSFYLAAWFAIVSAVVSAVVSFWAANGDAILAKASEIWNAVSAAISSAITTVAAIITAVASGIQSFWAAHGAAILTIAAFYWNDIQSRISGIINAIAAVISAVAGGISAFWSAWGGTIMAVAATAWSSIQTIVSTTMEVIGAVIEAISAAIRGDWTAFGAALRTAWDAAWEGIFQIIRNAATSMSAIVANLIATVKGVWTGTDWGALGKSMIDGVINGLRNAAGGLLDAARSAARNAFDAAMGAIQGHSPSKLFEEAGLSMMQGMALGIKRNAGLGSMAMAGAMADLGSIVPVMGLVGEDGGDRSVHYTSTTTVNTNRDPMRVLRAARHLDKLGALT